MNINKVAIDSNVYDIVDQSAQTELQSIKGQLQTIEQTYVKSSEKDAANGIPTLTSDSKIKTSQLPIATDTTVGVTKGGSTTTINSSGEIVVKNNAHTHTVSNITDLQENLNKFVEKTTTVNNHKLESNITLTASDVNAIPTSEKGVANGVASLDNNGKVPSNQLPSYVDDVVEGYYHNGEFYYDSTHNNKYNAEFDKIYIDLSTDKIYRYGGTQYVVISETISIGTTAQTAFRGDYGQIAYNHASKKGNTFSEGLYKFSTNEEGHVTSATPVTKSDFDKFDFTDIDIFVEETTLKIVNK